MAEFEGGTWEMSELEAIEDTGGTIACHNCGYILTISTLMNRVHKRDEDEDDIQGWHSSCPRCKKEVLIIND
jgi:Zn finger protein HypA/HybF involved in hydrogenase expression